MGENIIDSEFRTLPSLKSMRSDAKASLKGHWTNAVLCTLLFSVVIGAVAMIPWLGYVGTLLVALPLGFGYQVAMLRHMQGEPDDDLVTRPFQAFKDYGRYLGTSLLTSVFIFLWALLLIVPLIIKSYAYAMTPFIMREHPELSANECIDKSQEMMRGYKWKLFCLELSFIGWLLLGCLTLGILFLWIQPWMECSRIRFYEEIKGKPSATIA